MVNTRRSELLTNRHWAAAASHRRRSCQQ